MHDLEPTANESREPWVLVATYRDLPVAHVAVGMLEARGLTPKLTDEYTVGADWFLAIAIGGVGLGVPASQEETARELLDRDFFDVENSPDLPEELRPAADLAEVEEEERYFEKRRWRARLRGLLSFLFMAPNLLSLLFIAWYWRRLTADRPRREVDEVPAED